MRLRRYRERGLELRDDVPVRFAGVVDVAYDTSDVNANCLFIDLPTGGVVDVPVLLLGLTSADFGYFNGWTQPTLAIEDADGDSYVALTFSADDTPQLKVGGGATTLDIDATITNTTASGISFTATTTTVGTGHSGWALGFFGSTNLSSTSGVCGSAAGGVFEVNLTSSFSGSTSGILAGAFIGAYCNSTCGELPTAGLWIETIAGTGVSFQADGSNTDMPMIALVTSGAGTESSLAIEFGSEIAGKQVTITSGGMFYNGTIQMKANGTLIYMPTSTAEGSYTVEATVAKGINFTGATLTQSWDNAFFAVGSGNGSAGTQKSVTATTHYIPLQVNLVSIANPTGVSELSAAMLRFDADTADQANASIDVLTLRSDIAKNVYAATCINASLNISADIAVPTATVQGIFVQITGDKTITSPNTVNVLEAVYKQTAGGGGVDNVGAFVCNATGCTISNILWVKNYGGTATNGILIEGTLTKGIDLTDGCTTGIDIGNCTTGINISGTVGTSSIIVGTADTGPVMAGATPINVGIYSVFTGVAKATVGRGLYVKSTYTPATDGRGSMYGVRGQCGLGASSTHIEETDEYLVGIQGLYLMSGTGTLNGAGITVAGVSGHVHAGGTWTEVNVACGVEAKIGLDDVPTGIYTGVYVYHYGGAGVIADSVLHAKGWFTTGIDFTGLDGTMTTGFDFGDQCTTAIDIGDATTGIALTGAMDDGILISGAMVDNGIEITGVCGGNAILVTSTTATTGLTDIELNATFTGTTQWESHEGLQSTVTYTPAGGTGSCWTQAIGGTVVINGEIDAQTVYKGIGATLNFASAADYNGSGGLAVALTASITTESSATIQDGNIAIMHLNCASSNTALTGTAGICTFLFFDADSGHGTGAMDSAMRFHTWQTPYLFDFPPGGYCDGFMDSGAQEGEECVGHIKCRWNNADCYINVFSDNS